MMWSEPTAAVVLGELGLVRCLGEKGIPVIVVATSEEHLAFASRYCRQAVCVPSFDSQCQETLDIFLAIGKQHPGSVILCNGEPDLLFVSNNRLALQDNFQLNLPSTHQVDALINKGAFYDLAVAHEMPVPRTLCPKSLDELKFSLPSLEFPCVIKPVQQCFWKGRQFAAQFGEGIKAVRVDSADELLEHFSSLHAFHPEVLVQKFVSGRDDQLYFVDAYFNEHSQLLNYFVGQRIRTYPIHCGLSTLAQTVHADHVAEPALLGLGRIGYTGAAHVDIKVDSSTGEPYILEINPRFGLTIDLGAAAGANLPMTVYDHLSPAQKSPTPQPIPAGRTIPLPTYKAGMKWVDSKQDLKALLKYRAEGEWSVPQWLESLQGPKLYRVLSRKDPRPFMTATGTIVRKQSQRAWRRLQKSARRNLRSTAAAVRALGRRPKTPNARRPYLS